MNPFRIEARTASLWLVIVSDSLTTEKIKIYRISSAKFFIYDQNICRNIDLLSIRNAEVSQDLRASGLEKVSTQIDNTANAQLQFHRNKKKKYLYTLA